MKLEGKELIGKLTKNIGLTLLPEPIRMLVETILSCGDSEELKNRFDGIKKYAGEIAKGAIFPEIAVEQEVRWVNLIVIQTIDPTDSTLESNIKEYLTEIDPVFEPEIEILREGIWLTVEMPGEDAREVAQKLCEYLEKESAVKVKAVSYI